MATTFGCAENVIVWLGEATDYSPLGMKILDYFANASQPEDKPPWRASAPALVREALLDVMGRPWFERIWVVQEAVLSQRATVVCGHDTFTWNSKGVTEVYEFMRMIKFAEISPQWHEAGLDVVNMRPLLDLLDLQVGQQLDRTFGVSHRRPPDILDIAYNLRGRGSSDRRDKIFALLGMQQDYLDKPFPVDYKMDTEEVYRTLLRAIVF